MIDIRRPLLIALGMLATVVVQTTLFGRVRLGGIAPDIVILAIVLMALRARPETTMLAAFSVGFLFDAAAASSALGLRAIAYTTVAFVAVRTRDRADLGPAVVAVWAGLLTAVGIGVILLVGTLFGQFTMGFAEVSRRLLLVPVFNSAIALLLSPFTSRLLDGRRGVPGF